jgi:hypothetical protein
MSYIPLLSSATRAQFTTSTTVNHTISLEDRLIIVTGSTPTITLPSADSTGYDSNQGLFFTVATWGSGTATLVRAGASDTIGDGSASSKSLAVYSSITVTVSGSSGWIIVSTSGTVT